MNTQTDIARLRLLLLCFASLLLFCACNAGSGNGLDDNGFPISEAPVDTPTQPEPPAEDESGLSPTLASLQENVLTPICAQCHIGGNAPLGLQMDTVENSTANLINVDAVTNPQFKRVQPGNAANSFLYLKVIGDPQAGARMPLGQTPLDDATIALFEEWIDNGAPTDANQLVVASVASKPSISAGIATLEVKFSQAIEPSSLLPSQISLAVKQNGTFTSVGADQIQLNWINPQQLAISFVLSTTAFSGISMQLNQPAISTIISQQDVILDGDRDGLPGGVFNYEN